MEKFTQTHLKFLHVYKGTSSLLDKFSAYYNNDSLKNAEALNSELDDFVRTVSELSESIYECIQKEMPDLDDEQNEEILENIGEENE